MSVESRRAIIQTIEQKRGSRVITYLTGDRPNLSVPIAGDAVPLIHEHLLAIPPQERCRLDLVLYSRGGDSDAPWAIVSMFREYCGDGSFNVLIPFRAHSAATVISLGADEIVMTRKAELGPIDATLATGPYNPREEKSQEPLPVSVEDVMGYFALLEKLNCQSPDQKLKGFEQLTAKVHPLVLGSVSRQLEQTQLVALKLLSTRTYPFPEEKNQAIVKRLSSEIGSHGHTISRTEASEYLGLEQARPADACGIEDELWQLYTEYRQLLCLEEPFRPEEYLILHDLEENTWSDLNVACIESTARCDIWKADIRVRKLRQVPPEVTVSLNNVALPAINVPNLPRGTTPEQVGQLVEQVAHNTVKAFLAEAAEQAVAQLIRALPIAGFERTALNSAWVCQ